MSRQLISRSADLKRLREEGYELEVQGGYLLIRHVPYVNSAKNVCFGVLVSKLVLAGEQTTKPDNHVAYFAGEYPCNRDGSPIEGIRHVSASQTLHEGLVVNHSFSNKPAEGYLDYHAKMTRYVEMIAAPAKALDPSATATTFAAVEDGDAESVFVYTDTNSSRAEINVISNKFTALKVAIVGLGGTGTYILDLVAKVPVAEIHLYDGDRFVQHNAFRSPGAATAEELRATPYKTDHFKAIYSRMHKGIHSHPSYIDPKNVAALGTVDFVFLAVDKAGVKKLIFEELTARGIPFVDVGMGVEAVDGRLRGTLRATSSTAKMRTHVHKRISLSDDEDDEYRSNIQIADLNMLNAALAVIKWKKLYQFYVDYEHENHTTYTIDVHMLSGDDREA